MESHIKKFTQYCHFQLKNIGKISDLTDKDIAHMLLHSLVTSRIDYCNCLYAGVPSYLPWKHCKHFKHDSKGFFNYCIGCLCKKKKRVDFKIACIIFKSLNNLPPSYIQDLLEIYKPTRAMRPSASISLKTSIPPNSFVGRAFSFNAPKIGNNLSHGTRSCASFQSFKKCLKTESFKLYIGF